MEPSDRRIGVRVDLELFLTQYVRDRPYRVMSTNLSETGVFVHRVALGGEPALPAGTVVGLELELPETSEVVWARGQVCRDSWGRQIAGTGVRFADMPRVHARLVRDYCHHQRRLRLDSMLDRIRKMPASGHGRLPAAAMAARSARPLRRVPPPPSRRIA